MAFCLEVAEHIENKYSKRLVENLIKLSNCVVFTAAPPGQGGHFHINEQPKEFWIGIFNEYGYYLNVQTTEKLKLEMQKGNILWWYSKNLMCFKKNAQETK